MFSLFFIDARTNTANMTQTASRSSGVCTDIRRNIAVPLLPAYQSLFAEIDLAFAAEEVQRLFLHRQKGGWTDTLITKCG